MTTSFYNGVGGMKTSQVGIDVLSDNISNVNTTGYKQQITDFSTLFSTSMAIGGASPVTSDIGYASTAPSTEMDLSQGAIAQTDNVFDMAINGKGWMAVKDGNNQTYYTRTGSFTRDANGTLVSANGDKLQVVNANNLTFDGKNWNFDATIPTDNLVTNNATLSSIDLPNNIVFPAQPTTQVKIAGNLPNTDIAPDPKAAIDSSDFGVLYDKNAQNMNIRDGQDVVFGFGDNVSYDGLAKYSFCVADDEIDGNNVNIDFDVNGENIKLTLPDGSKAKDITDAIAKALDDKNILYDKTDDSITLKNDNKMYVKSNGGDVVTQNGAIEKEIYNSKSNEGTNFTTMQDFEDNLQNLANFTYGSDVTVGLDDSGKLFIRNDNTNDITAKSYATDNSNDMFIQNISNLGNIVKGGTSSSSLEFNRNHQGFTGDIIDTNGDKNDLKFDYYKTKIDNDTTTWNLVVSEIDNNGKVISSTNQDLTFDKVGGLIKPNPATLTIDNNGTKTNIDLGGNFSGITSLDKSNVGFAYSQDGFIKGDLNNYGVTDNGEIFATFSNGKMGILGQIPLYHFQNEQGLDSVGGNKYTMTDNSGKASIYQSTDGNYLAGATIKTNSLEMSNVNLAQAMTEIIVVQKAYEANSKSITTSDQMIQKAIDMKK